MCKRLSNISLHIVVLYGKSTTFSKGKSESQSDSELLMSVKLLTHLHKSTIMRLAIT